MRLLIIGVGVVVLALWYLATVLPAGAYTQQSPYPYGDANKDTAVDIADYARIKGVILGSVAKTSAADANMDGDADISDFARVKSIILESQTAHDRYVAIYDFNTAGAGSDDLAASKQVAALPGGRWVSAGETGWTNFSGGDYTDVEAIDANDFNMGANATGCNSVQCRFKVDEVANASALTHLQIDLNAGTTAAQSPDVEFYAWNFTAAGWTLVGDATMNGTTQENFSAVSDWGPSVVDDYIDASGHVFIMVIVTTANRALDVNYVRLVLVEPYDDGVPP